MALVHDSFSDFPLFPREPAHFEMPNQDDFSALRYGAHSRPDYQQQYSESSYDSYPAVSVYSSESHNYYPAPPYHMDAVKGQSGPEQRRYTPAGSPSPSISQAYDHPPSTLSSTSGASVQSTASSAVGSPYSHATQGLPGHEQWTESHHGLGIAPGIVHNDGLGHDSMFPLPGMEGDMIFGENKHQSSFVGESGKFSSSSFPSSQPFPSISSSSAVQPFVPAFSSPSTNMAYGTDSTRRNVTIDTILEEANIQVASPRQSGSPISVHSANSPIEAHQGAHRSASSPPVPSNSFKSPSTPASAMSPFLPSPSVQSGRWQRDSSRQPSASGQERRVRKTSLSPTDRYAPYARPLPPPPVQDQFPTVQSQSPFFSQSSGRFIPPLESSCWFS